MLGDSPRDTIFSPNCNLFHKKVLPLQLLTEKIVNRSLLRFIYVAALLCGCLGSTAGVKVQRVVNERPAHEEQVRRDDGWTHNMAEEPQSVQGFTLRPSTSHRVNSTRPTRLLQTYGGKPGLQHGRNIHHESFHFLKYTGLCSYRNHVCLRKSAASQRHYYVLMLRRLLC